MPKALEKVIEELKEICPKAIPDYVKMIFLDTIVTNPDRHTANFGLLRNTKTGELTGFAPVFDHNMALIFSPGIHLNHRSYQKHTGTCGTNTAGKQGAHCKKSCIHPG